MSLSHTYRIRQVCLLHHILINGGPLSKTNYLLASLDINHLTRDKKTTLFVSHNHYNQGRISYDFSTRRTNILITFFKTINIFTQTQNVLVRVGMSDRTYTK